MKTIKLTAKTIKELGAFQALKFNKDGSISAEATIIVMNDTEAKVEFVTGEEKVMKIDSIRRNWEAVQVEETEGDNLEAVETAVGQAEVNEENAEQLELIEVTAEAVQPSETAQEQQEQSQAEQEQPQAEETAQEPAVSSDEPRPEGEPVEAITLIEATMQATEQGNQKDFFRFNFRGQVIEVVDYARVTMIARVFQDGSEVFKSKKLSVNDVLVNHFKLEGEELKHAKKVISTLKKGARA